MDLLDKFIQFHLRNSESSNETNLNRWLRNNSVKLTLEEVVIFLQQAALIRGLHRTAKQYLEEELIK